MTPPKHEITCEFMLINEMISYYLQHDDGGCSSDVRSNMALVALRARARYQLSNNMGNITYCNKFKEVLWWLSFPGIG